MLTERQRDFSRTLTGFQNELQFQNCRVTRLPLLATVLGIRDFTLRNAIRKDIAIY